MKPTKAIHCRWDGAAFHPHEQDRPFCNTEFVPGFLYTLEPVFPRSVASERHQMATINEGFKQLPFEYSWLTSPNHLRKYLLIQEGFCQVEHFPFDTRDDAVRMMALAQAVDPYAIVTIDDEQRTVVRYTAQSQSRKSMTAKEFRESKQRLLDRLAAMIGVTSETLQDSSHWGT